MASYPQQRIFNLAARLGITMREAGRLCALKGQRLRREKSRQCACIDMEKTEQERARAIRAMRWDLREEDAA